MKTAPVSLLLGVCVLWFSALTVAAVSLHVSPNFQQFFSGPSAVFLSCVDDNGDGQTVDGWTVRRTRGGLTEACGAAADFTMNDSLCVLDRNSSYSGTFWCESSSGQKSDEVPISVSKKGVILEIPALPVRPGSDVTLQCKKKNGEPVPSYIFMNGRLLGAGSRSEHVIRRSQQSDEGLYWCATDTFGESPQSFLRVRGPPITSLKASVHPVSGTIPSLSTLPPPTNSSSPPPPPSVPLIRVFCHLLVFCLYCVCTILLLSMCCSRSSGSKYAVSTEMPLHNEEYDDIVADITTEYIF
ncbi:uncharacterized protein LOC115775857 [Archocentrus centrarchus]|uniref:uncharacterized protein LOC115775857 n=1 Tax=Archocentrus centrarchus TaxID=63155 RepID=UPI0011E9C6D3|nr:uncharacterized protein LOC115775857 [Archocentrus centrarchus]